MEKILQYEGEKIVYRISGDGKPVILIHGFAEDHTIWVHQTSYLQNYFRIIVPDIPGSGLSSSAIQPGDATMDAYADSIKAIIDAEKIDQCVVIGHSMGGYITLALAEKHPGYLAGFGLFHSTAYPDSEEKKSMRKKSNEFIRQHGSTLFIQQSVPNLFSDAFKKNNPEIVEKLIEKYSVFNPQSLISYYEAMIRRPNRVSTLETCQKPVLFIAGEEDKAILLQHVLEQCHIPRLSYLHVLENTAHMGMLENANQSNRWIENFLKQILN